MTHSLIGLGETGKAGKIGEVGKIGNPAGEKIEEIEEMEKTESISDFGFSDCGDGEKVNDFLSIRILCRELDFSFTPAYRQAGISTF